MVRWRPATARRSRRAMPRRISDPTVRRNRRVLLPLSFARSTAASRPKRQRGGRSKRRTRKRVPLAVLFVDTRRMADSDVLARLLRDPAEAVDEQWVNWWAENGWSPDITWRAIEGAPDDAGPMHGRERLGRHYGEWL